MIRVRLGGPLMSLAGGVTEFEIEAREARTIRGMLDALGTRHPQLQPILARGVAVAIDGTIYREAFLQPIPDGAEVYLLPQLVGG